MEYDSDDDNAPVPSKHQRKNANAKTAGLKAELKHLLAQPLIARGVSTRYITSGSRPIVDDMIKGECAYSFSLLSFRIALLKWLRYPVYRSLPHCLMANACFFFFAPHSRLGLDHETMLGLKKTQAGHDVVAQKRKPKKVKKEEAEEWHGFSA